MKPYAQMDPRTKKGRLMTYNQRIHSTPDSIAVMNKWNLELERDLLKINGIKLAHETLDFGNKREMRWVTFAVDILA